MIYAAVAALATLASADLHREPALGCGWRKASGLSAEASQSVSFTLSVKESNLGELKTFVKDVSNPRSPNYARYMTTKEVLAFTAPRQEDLDAVVEWVSRQAECSYTISNGRNVRVTCPVDAAENLLATRFHELTHKRRSDRLVRAGSYYLPSDVESAVAAVFGLHGLPLPPRDDEPNPTAPADVTPAVLASTYKISGVKVSRGDTNRLSVAEFQGQYEKDSDLAQFFKQYVPDAQAGDEKISKFVGDKDQQQAGVEASLDIQYIMGVAPGVKAEFWLYANQDFCADLENYTSTILSDEQPSLVHSVSYGWQGNLTQVQCTDDKVNVVDANFVKIGATGVTIVFASGDSGSGYSNRPTCDPSTEKQDTAYQGTVLRTEPAPEATECCEIAGEEGYSYTWTPASGPAPSGATCQPGDIGTEGTAYEGEAYRTLMVPATEPQICCEITQQESTSGYTSFSFIPVSSTQANCTIWKSTSGSKSVKGAYSGKAAPRQEGNCSFFKEVTGTSSQKGSISGGQQSGNVVLWPSWPASSPWVTAVGATRFVGQQVGNEEMASDQFGSGGGFSKMFSQSPDAEWQTEAVKKYTDNPPQDPTYPPAGSFPTTGRATPDVSALGEGYQVVTNGKVGAVGGTSASAPAFAGMVALLNEARIQAGKKSLGFLNPFLYQNADAFTDVTKGTNAIGRGTGPIKYGFNCTAGWDPATGLGTPIFSKLLEAALKAN